MGKMILQSSTVIFSIARLIQLSSVVAKESTAVNRQVKVLRKLLGNRESGSKKRWYPSEKNSSPKLVTNPNNLIQINRHEGKNVSRRISVLNKLFMRYITDLLATGEISDRLVGKGLEISRVCVTPDFNGINVFWIAKGTEVDPEIESILSKHSGLIRHELSQLQLMGEVPRIYFVKDKTYSNLAEVENILRKCDFGEDHTQPDYGHFLREELHLESLEKKTPSSESNVEETISPTMRHDILGLDHQEIMAKILAKMKKSQDAWKMREENPSKKTYDIKSVEKTSKLQVADSKSEEEFKKFLQKNKARQFKHKNLQYELSFLYSNSSFDEDQLQGNKSEEDYIVEDTNDKLKPF